MIDHTNIHTYIKKIGYLSWCPVVLICFVEPETNEGRLDCPEKWDGPMIRHKNESVE